MLSVLLPVSYKRTRYFVPVDINVDPSLCRELINCTSYFSNVKLTWAHISSVFFAQYGNNCLSPSESTLLTNMSSNSVHPYSSILYRPTFMAVLMSGEIPAYLLNAILAVASPLSMHPAVQSVVETGSGFVRTPWRAGMQFVEAALAQLTSGNTEEVDLSRFPGQELEVAQTLIFLSLHDTCARRDGAPRTFHKQAREILSLLSPAQWDTQDTRSPRSGGSNERAIKAAWIHQESLRRTIWLTHWVMMMASAAALRQQPINEMELGMPLPIDEGVFDLSITETIPPGNSRTTCLILSELIFFLQLI